jgi:hypothetical protein
LAIEGKRVTLIAALCLLCGLGGLLAIVPGCGDSKDKQPAAESQEEEPAEEASGGEKSSVPSSLDETESAAEDIIELADAGKRAQVKAKARELVAVTAGEAGTALREAGVPRSRIETLRDRAERVEDYARNAALFKVSLAANQISELMPEFFARYDVAIPPDVLKLDYLDREALLESRAHENSAVRKAVNDLASTYAELRSKVIEAGGDKEARDFTRHVESMERLVQSSNGQALQEEAAKGLELVDVLEGVFRNQ